MTKKERDNQNEGIGIITIIAVVILAVLALYFFWGHHEKSIEGQTIATVPTEAPVPVEVEPTTTMDNQTKNVDGSTTSNAP